MRQTVQFFLLAAVMTSLSCRAAAQEQIDRLPSSGLSVQTITSGTVRGIIIYCVNPGENDVIPDYLLNYGASTLSSYFPLATFGHVNFQVDAVMKRDATHAFVSRVPYDFEAWIVQDAFIRDILSQADDIYDFSQFDYDHDGYVDRILFTFLNYSSRGLGGLDLSGEFTTNDGVKISGSSGIMIRKDLRDLQSQQYDYVLLWAHELAHILFDFPDMDHSWYNFNHYSTGAFDLMAGCGFQNYPSPFNPWFTEDRGWATPTSITSNTMSAPVSDYYTGGVGYKFAPTLPSNAAPYQKFYVTYHKYNTVNFTTVKWPLDETSGGILIWHTQKEHTYLSDTWGGYYQDAHKMPIAVEAAHGRYVWQDYPDSVHNTGVPDPLTGFDSLEIRKMDANHREIQGPYLDPVTHLSKDHGSASVLYVPNLGREFAFYTNPNSNLYNASASQLYARNVTDGFAVKNMHTSGSSAYIDIYTDNYTITQNTTLTAGTWYINGTITVPSGVTLSISPGTTLNFTNGSSLVVNGRIVANGTASNPITFDFGTRSADGIVFSGDGDNSSLSYCTIRNAASGIYADGSFPFIQHCTITNNAQGISINNASVSSNYISDNAITANTYYGMYLWNTSPTNVLSNTISNNGIYGIMCSAGSVPYLRFNTISYNSNKGVTCYTMSSAHFAGIYGDPGYNSIYGNRILGVWGYDQSNLYMGQWDPGFNSVLCDYEQAWAAAASVNTHITARYNWWGRYPPDPSEFNYDGTSSIDYSNALSYNPTGSLRVTSPPIAMATANAQAPEIPSSTASLSDKRTVSGDTLGFSFHDPSLEDALDSLIHGNFNAAILLYSARLKTETDLQKKAYTLVQLGECYRLAGKGKEFLAFLNAGVMPGLKAQGDFYATALRLKNLFLINDRQYDEATKNYETLLKNFAGDSVVCKDALFNLGHLYLSGGKDIRTARRYWDELSAKYPGDALTLESKILLAGCNPTNSGSPGMNMMKSGSMKETETSDSSTTAAAEFSLGNYPNPFNPSTTIRYALPTSCHVTLKIYDVLGREVATLVNEHMDAGIHSVQFNGQDFSSGLFFYRITAGKYSAVRKMLLVK